MSRSSIEAAFIFPQEKHEFALYIEERFATALEEEQKFLIINDSSTIHRISDILRLKLGDSIIFFDKSHHALCLLKQASKKELVFQVNDFKTNLILTPSITAYMPLLKRDDLEQGVYDLTAIGVTTIQLVMTTKVQRTWQQKELARLQKIIVAAAEQSKNFSFPTIKEPISFDDISESDDTVYRVFADPKGKPLLEVMNDISTMRTKKIHVLVGPEGDLTEDEKKQAQKLRFVFCRLTPTVLKSFQAMSILAAVCRSL